MRVLNLVVCIFFLSSTVIGQDVAPKDERLADPEFVRLRDEATAAAKCADRTNPVAVSTPPVPYPKELLGSRVQGSAIVEGLLLVDGTVKYTRVMKADAREFSRESLEVLKRYRYKPAMCGGVAVPSVVTIHHTFSIR